MAGTNIYWLIMKTKAIIFDLDGTLCELSDSSNPYNHDGEEVIILEMALILESFEQYWAKIIILTWRKKKEYWHITVQWLWENEIYYDEVIMQEWNTAKQNHIYKREKLIELKEKYDIIAMFDDNPDLIPVCKELWILLLQVHK